MLQLGQTGRRSSFASLPLHLLYWSLCFCDHVQAHLQSLLHCYCLPVLVINILIMPGKFSCPIVVGLHWQSNINIVSSLSEVGYMVFPPPWILQTDLIRVTCHFFPCFVPLMASVATKTRKEVTRYSY